MFNLTRLRYVLFVAGCLGASIVYADIPVVEGVGSSPDASQQGTAVVSPDTSTQAGALPDADTSESMGTSSSSYTPPSNLTMSQRVSKLEHQMANQIDLMNQIQNLKQQVQDLQGKLDISQHALDKLKQQQLSMYQDLNSRIGGGGKTAPSAVATTTDSDIKDSTDSTTADLDSKAASKDTTSDNIDKEQTVYQESYGFIKKGDYPKAITSLKKYVKLYPKGQYAANAHYWLGEIYYIQNDSKSAIAQFKDVIEQFPKDTKVADAKLKIGFVYFDNGQMQLSKKYLDEVVKDYPGSSAAKLADARLKQITKLS